VVRGGAAKALKTTVGAGYLASVGAIRNASEFVWEEVGSA
jgi:NADH dehydrogenase